MLKTSALPLILLLQSCHSSVGSSPKGHYEGMSSDAAETLAATHPKVIPEYGVTNTVVIAADLIRDDRYARHDLAQAVLAAGAKLLVITGTGANSTLYGEPFIGTWDLDKKYPNMIELVSMSSQPSIWARDWAPLEALNATGTHVFVDNNYYNDNPVDDYAPQMLTKRATGAMRLSMPVYNEGGNFMVNSRGECLMTTHVVDANSKPSITYFVSTSGSVLFDSSGQPLTSSAAALAADPTSHPVVGTLYIDSLLGPLVRTDDVDLSSDQITNYYLRYAGCTRVSLLPKMPDEKTGHIDMVAKFVDDDTVLVSQISDAQIANAIYSAEQTEAVKIKAYLDDLAVRVKSLGYKVVTIPIPLPQIRQHEGGAQEFVFRSYTNSLLINHGGVLSAIVPHYETALLDGAASASGSNALSQQYTDTSALAAYEATVQAVYVAAGYTVSFVTSDNLIRAGGAVHCTTMQFNSDF